MLKDSDIENIFFLGIGGIGMSALARYYRACGKHISGYDRTPSALTQELEREGIRITYTDSPEIAQRLGLTAQNTLVVRTPAVPEDSELYVWLRSNGFDIRKRSEVLGDVTRSMHALCVAGTHGKTTTSTMLAHILHDRVAAFLGGISMNYGTNYWKSPDAHYAVVEADEYDRSFHRLTPYISVITAVDPDHLDIYGTPEAYREAFEHYTSLITGALVIKQGLPVTPRLQPGVKKYTYGVMTNGECAEGECPDFYADNIRVANGTITFDFHTPEDVITDIRPGVPVWVNIENATAALAVAWLVGKEQTNSYALFVSHLKESMASFRGVQRRFNIHVNTPKVVYIDDYAHHPDEIATSIDSVRRLYQDRKFIGVFQPHLYSRTRDFADGFAHVLATLDECILLPVYPARELPISGVNSEMLLAKIGKGQLVEKSELARVLGDKVQNSNVPVTVMTIGAGDIDRLVPAITEVLKSE
ncbi:MAG: UDP-N-acetylmuramate--L-alanine ligase [Paludibacteraceae bacterium]|nr:UDP-N-acetylmuramate--L-alanine ligase [Paludibacteraceae bacterium]